MSSEEEIDEQKKRLDIHRCTLTLSLDQKALHTKAYSPPIIEHEIREARANIRPVKKTLRDWGVSVEDHPDDADTAAPTQGQVDSSITTPPSLQRKRIWLLRRYLIWV